MGNPRIPLFLFFHLFSLLLALSSAGFSPPDNHLIACGSASASTLDDRRVFLPDSAAILRSSGSKISISTAPPDASPASSPLFRTARVFTRPSSYEFQIKQKGTHIIRLDLLQRHRSLRTTPRRHRSASASIASITAILHRQRHPLPPASTAARTPFAAGVLRRHLRHSPSPETVGLLPYFLKSQCCTIVDAARVLKQTRLLNCRLHSLGYILNINMFRVFSAIFLFIPLIFGDFRSEDFDLAGDDPMAGHLAQIRSDLTRPEFVISRAI